ncbi:MAG: DEAD/DEAH box helicase [Myxococcota bacterium]
MSSPSPSSSDPLAAFGPDARRWFAQEFGEPTPVQAQGWAEIAAGKHALLLAPTGSGKTLAAFFYWIDQLVRRPAPEPGVRVLYVSPLKALVYDIERNLRAPLAGLRAGMAPDDAVRWPRVAVRTGDTTPHERRQQARDPAEILVTTPESLYLILGSRQRDTLASLEAVVVDEVHALAGTKRGAHLALSLERVEAIAERAPQRIGLSATARPLDEIAHYLGGDRSVEIVDTSSTPLLDLTISVPVPDMTQPDRYPLPQGAASDGEGAEAPPRPDALGESGGLWPALYPELLEQIRAHQSTIVFTNSRGLCERLTQRLNDLAGEPLARAHHGSVAHAKRREIEEALKAGQLRAIVATSSLELGIDMGAVDLVLLVESPGAVARGLQRIGRAGHQVGVASRGRLYPKHRGDLLEAAVVADGMGAGAVEPLRVPQNPLDVLAQQIVAICGMDATTVADLEALLQRTHAFKTLSREVLTGVLDMLSGRYPSTDFSELRARLRWDRESDRLEALPGSKTLSLVSGGTIPDRGLYPVHRGSDGPRIGELDEEMVHETRPGDAVTLGASTWRVEEISRDRVIVSPAPGEVGRLPFWRGEGPGRPIELGRALGRFVRRLADQAGAPKPLHEGRDRAERWLREEHTLDEWAARNLVDYVVEQSESTGTLPTDRAITIERFRDELGDWRICILSPFGARLHAPWALAIEARLSRRAGYAVQTLWSDDGILLRFADADALPDSALLIPDPSEVEDEIVGQLANSALFASQFRENAARALLLPRRRPGARTPLWTQRLRAQNLLAVAREFPSFPIVLETYRACLQDVFDVPGLVSLLEEIGRGEVRVEDVETRQASAFARSLVFEYTAQYLYQGDTPVAERRAQALTLDRAMLRDLLGQEDLRDLLDARVIEDTEVTLQQRGPEERARHPDALHDRLRRFGDLSEAELSARCAEDPSEWLESLAVTQRAVDVEIAGERRWIAAEDAGLYRDALGLAPSKGLPAAFLEPTARSLEQLVVRFARQRGPFTVDACAARFGLAPGAVEPVLEALVQRDRLLHGDFHPDGDAPEWCDPEVLRQLRRRTLAKLRAEVAPVDDETWTRFLGEWHGLGDERGGDPALQRALEQLEGCPLSFAELERLMLPARVPDYDPQALDAQGAQGEWVWIGCEPLGERDGRVALYRRERVALLAEAPPRPDDLTPLETAILDQLEARGASFTQGLLAALDGTSQSELYEALWGLVWKGQVTNDTFAPLRTLAARRDLRPRRGRRRPGGALGSVGGRWSTVGQLIGSEAPPTRRAHARSLLLLERYGVASRDAMPLEGWLGGFAAVYPVLRAMEDAGKLRRGHFVDALPGAQFAFAGAVDRLRAARRTSAGPASARDVWVLAATDPANPFGVSLGWPAPCGGEGTPRRASGASVVIVEGTLALYLEAAGTRLVTFGSLPDGEENPGEAERIERAARGLHRLFRHRARTTLRIERIDGATATTSPWRESFVRAGFRAEYKALVLDRSDAREVHPGTRG